MHFGKLPHFIVFSGAQLKTLKLMEFDSFFLEVGVRACFLACSPVERTRAELLV
jgi:hypothetical protein